MDYKKITKAGVFEILKCPFCGEVCEVERNKIKPKITGIVSAMHWNSVPNPYDEFQCPNNNTRWHKTIMEYYEELDRTKSPSLRELILKDISDLKFRRKTNCLV